VEFPTPLDYEQIPFKCHICHDHGHFAKNCPKSQQSQPPPIEEPEFKTVTRKRRKPQHKGLPQPRKPQGSLQNNQFGALGNLGDTENPEELGRIQDYTLSKVQNRSPEEPMVSSKEDKKEVDSAEEEGEDVQETEEEDGEDNEETEEEEVEVAELKDGRKNFRSWEFGSKSAVSFDPSKSFSFVDALKNSAPNPSPPLTREGGLKRTR
jgi:hypothetical protein